MDEFIRRRLTMGWLPDYPDFRDLTVDQENVSTRLKGLGQNDSIKEMLSKTGASPTAKATIP
ncbi:MAG: cysteine protease, partial [Bacteroidota bacterium]|nr:cysteine protease [Bacteroidota bacterium]